MHSALAWVQRSHLFRNDLLALDEGEMALAGAPVTWFRIMGRPANTYTLREAVVTHVEHAGYEIVMAVHYDAYNRQRHQERAFDLLGSMVLQDGEGSDPARALGDLEVNAQGAQ
jgi:hypothetical protein